MLAKRLPSILPPLTFEEALETTKIHSVAGLMAPTRPSWPPDRSGRRTTRYLMQPLSAGRRATSWRDLPLPSWGALPGRAPGVRPECPGGAPATPRGGERDHKPVETLRDLPSEFHAGLRYESLSVWPLRGSEQRVCMPGRERAEVYDADFGTVDGPDRSPYRSPDSKIPGTCQQREGGAFGSDPVEGDRRRARQAERFTGRKGLYANADMQSSEIREFCRIDGAGEELLKMAITKLGLSARAYDRILKVARTIADLGASDTIKPEHIAEAIQYRSLDRSLL